MPASESGPHSGSSVRPASQRTTPRAANRPQDHAGPCYAARMFNPSQADVRRFFCTVRAKTREGQPLDALETLAGQWLEEHPEYEGELTDVEAALARTYDGLDGRTNPFLHLAMHLSISEQCSIDQPRGIRQAVELLAARRNSLHDAHHEAME